MMACSRSFTTQDGRLIGRKEATLLGDLLAFSNGMMLIIQICGQSAPWNEELKMKRCSWKDNEPSDLKNDDGVLSGPAAPLRFIFWIADRSSAILMGKQLWSSTIGFSRLFLRRRLSCRSSFVIWSLLTLRSDVSFSFCVRDGATVVWHGFIRWVGIWSVVETLSNRPHARSSEIWDGVL